MWLSDGICRLGPLSCTGTFSQNPVIKVGALKEHNVSDFNDGIGLKGRVSDYCHKIFCVKWKMLREPPQKKVFRFSQTSTFLPFLLECLTHRRELCYCYKEPTRVSSGEMRTNGRYQSRAGRKQRGWKLHVHQAAVVRLKWHMAGSARRVAWQAHVFHTYDCKNVERSRQHDSCGSCVAADE